MAKKLYIGVNGVAQEAEDIFVGVNGVAKKIIKGYVGVENEAKLFWEKQQQTTKITIFYDGDFPLTGNEDLDNMHYGSINSNEYPVIQPALGGYNGIIVYRKNHTDTIQKIEITTQEQLNNLKSIPGSSSVNLHLNQIAFKIPAYGNKAQTVMIIPITFITDPKKINVYYYNGRTYGSNTGGTIRVRFNYGSSGETYPTDCFIREYQNDYAFLNNNILNSYGNIDIATLDLTSVVRNPKRISEIWIWAYQQDIVIYKIEVEV